MSTFGPGDTVRVTLNDVSGSHEDRDVSLTDFRSGLNAPLEGVSRVTKDVTISLTDLGALSVTTGIIVPVGANVVSVSAKNQTLVVAGGTTAKVGIGLDPAGTVSDDHDKYGKTADLVAGTKFATLFDFVAITVEEEIFICGVTSAGTALGNTNISAGSVRVIVVYDLPVALA